MKTDIITIKKIKNYLLMGFVVVLASSCNSYKYVNDNDGIYGNGRTVEVENTVEEIPVDKNNYYKQYFSSKLDQYGIPEEESLIFTDIDAYRTQESLDDEGYVIQEQRNPNEQYGGWGSNNGNVTVNVYDNGWNNWGWGLNAGWGWGGPWGWNAGWGWGWNNWGWGGPWGWNAGWGWGWNNWGWGGPWGWNAGWGWGWNNWGWNNWGWNNHFGNHGYAFNRGRRNLDYYNGRVSYLRNQNVGRTNTVGRGNYGRGEITRRTNRDGNFTRGNSRGTNQTFSRGANSRGNNNTYSRPSNSNRGGSYSRPSNSNRGGSFSRPSSSRGSGSMRSGGGMRSGSGMRGGGGGSRGGGGRGGRG